MLAAIRDDTTIVYVCNPNNPTGTVVAADALAALVEEVPERVLVVIDEAYHEYADDPSHSTAVPLAVERPNVVVMRTFSKIHGLAALRVGYAVSAAENIVELRKAQAPFTITTMAQVAALESLAHPDEIAARAAFIARGRAYLETELERLGLTFVRSQANFVYFQLGAGTGQASEAFGRHGVIVRPLSNGWVRVSVGSAEENERFLRALEQVLPDLC
jgi:histidinol-phosphate aminotransferase